MIVFENPFGRGVASLNMVQNVGTRDRGFRALLASLLGVGAVIAPLSDLPRVLLGGLAVYVLFHRVGRDMFGISFDRPLHVSGEGSSVTTTTFQAALGDDDALAEVMRTYHDRVYNYGRRVCRDHFDAEDAVQEAFTKLATRQDVIAHPAAMAWLMTVVRNLCRRLVRPFARERRMLGTRVDVDIDIASDQPSPQLALERWELVKRVHDAIRALDPLYREVVVLRDLEGLSGDEAPATLGIPLAAMKARLHRAREKLRAELVQVRDEPTARAAATHANGLFPPGKREGITR